MKNNPYQPFKADILSVEKETPLEFTLRVKASAEINPGQFFQLSLPKIGEAPISVSRFSSDWIEFTIRAVGKLTNVFQNLKAGEAIFIRGPYGKGFPLEQFAGRDLVIVAGGSGLAPVRPLIELAANGSLNVSSFRLITGFKNSNGILFSRHLKEWAEKCDLTLTIDKPETGWSGKTGMVTEHIRKLSAADLTEAEVVVVGPDIMMKFSTQEFLMLGLKPEQIWVSYERLMSCGIGKCGHCKIDNTYICLDGPVLNFTKASALID
ncbi:MAG: anaerobic sulfite reductase subunit AsrB [Candidatus Rifleibacteriota bacterium]